MILCDIRSLNLIEKDKQHKYSSMAGQSNAIWFNIPTDDINDVCSQCFAVLFFVMIRNRVKSGNFSLEFQNQTNEWE